MYTLIKAVPGLSPWGGAILSWLPVHHIPVFPYCCTFCVTLIPTWTQSPPPPPLPRSCLSHCVLLLLVFPSRVHLILYSLSDRLPFGLNVNESEWRLSIVLVIPLSWWTGAACCFSFTLPPPVFLFHCVSGGLMRREQFSVQRNGRPPTTPILAVFILSFSSRGQLNLFSIPFLPHSFAPIKAPLLASVWAGEPIFSGSLAVFNSVMLMNRIGYIKRLINSMCKQCGKRKTHTEKQMEWATGAAVELFVERHQGKYDRTEDGSSVYGLLLWIYQIKLI